MNSKQRRALAAVVADPVSGNGAWTDDEGLLVAAGAPVIEGRGSRVRFEMDSEVETSHRPHPAKEAQRYQVRAARRCFASSPKCTAKPLAGELSGMSLNQWAEDVLDRAAKDLTSTPGSA